MLDKELIGKFGELKQPTICAFSGKALGGTYVTVSIGNGYYVRYRAAAQSLYDEKRIDELAETVKPKRVVKSKTTLSEGENE